MLIIGLLEQLIALTQGILGHFVSGNAGTATMLGDYEWTLSGFTSYHMTSKGNYLAGAVADIVTYGAILVDWIVQSLLNVQSSAFVNGVP